MCRKSFQLAKRVIISYKWEAFVYFWVKLRTHIWLQFEGKLHIGVRTERLTVDLTRTISFMTNRETPSEDAAEELWIIL